MSRQFVSGSAIKPDCFAEYGWSLRKQTHTFLYAVIASVIGATAAVTMLNSHIHSTVETPREPSSSKVTIALPKPSRMAIDDGAGQQPLQRAFTAAFGVPEQAIRRIGGTREATRFVPGQLLWTSFGPVLLSEGQVLGGTTASSGKLAVIYLSASAGQFRVQRSFVPAIEGGSMGRLGEWNVDLAFGHNPVIDVGGVNLGQGSDCAWTSLLELTPTGPIELARVPIYFDDSGSVRSGATQYQGTIVHIVRDQSFDVAYSGSMPFIDHYVRQGSRYTPVGGGHQRIAHC